MKEVNLANLKDAANRLLFDMLDEEYQSLLNDFKIIVKQMELIANDKSIDKYTPLIYPFPVEVDTLRKDKPNVPTNREEILKNAKNKLAGQIKVAKVNV